MENTVNRLLRDVGASTVDNVPTLVGTQINDYTVAVLAECITALSPQIDGRADIQAIGDIVKKLEAHFV